MNQCLLEYIPMYYQLSLMLSKLRVKWTTREIKKKII